MVSAADSAGPLQGPKVADLLDNDDERRIAALVTAERARGEGIEIAAFGAHDNSRRRLAQRGRERDQQLFALFDERQRRLARGARAETRQPRQKLDQSFDLVS